MADSNQAPSKHHARLSSPRGRAAQAGRAHLFRPPGPASSAAAAPPPSPASRHRPGAKRRGDVGPAHPPMLKSLATIVATPLKCVGLDLPQRGAWSLSTVTHVSAGPPGASSGTYRVAGSKRASARPWSCFHVWFVVVVVVVVVVDVVVVGGHSERAETHTRRKKKGGRPRKSGARGFPRREGGECTESSRRGE